VNDTHFNPASPMEECTWTLESTPSDIDRLRRNIERLRHRVRTETATTIQALSTITTHPADEQWPSPFTEGKQHEHAED